MIGTTANCYSPVAVLVVWAGPEIPISVLADRVKKTHATGVNFDLSAIGMGIRGSQVVELVQRFEGKYPTTLSQIGIGSARN